VARRLAEAARRDYPSRRDPQSARWYDAFARHAVVAPAVLELAAEREAHIPLRTSTRPAAGAVTPVGEEHPEPEPLAEVLLGLSPLTAVLHRPPLRRLKGEATAAERGTAAALLAHPRGRELLISGLCRWTADPDTLLWRGELLTVLDAEDRELMLDVYAAARLRHGADWDARIHRAGRMLAARGPADRLALATVRLWVPLARKARYGVALGPARPLMKGYEPVLSLIRTYDLTRAGA
jgi:hypothetical protein